MKISKDAARAARSLLRSTFVDGKLDMERAQKFVSRIGEAKPRGYQAILHAYLRGLKREAGKKEVLVETAAPINEGTKASLLADLKNKYGFDINTEFATNPDLIGGMRVKVGSDVWDGSVRARIARFAESL